MPEGHGPSPSLERIIPSGKSRAFMEETSVKGKIGDRD